MKGILYNYFISKWEFSKRQRSWYWILKRWPLQTAGNRNRVGSDPAWGPSFRLAEGAGEGRERGAASESQRTLAPTKTNNAAQHSWFLHFFFFLYSYYSRKSGLGLEHVAVTSSQLMYPSSTSTTTSPLLNAILLTRLGLSFAQVSRSGDYVTCNLRLRTLHAIALLAVNRTFLSSVRLWCRSTAKVFANAMKCPRTLTRDANWDVTYNRPIIGLYLKHE